MTNNTRTVKADLAAHRTADTEIVNAATPEATPAPRKGNFPLLPGVLTVPVTEGVPVYVYKAGSHGAHLRILATTTALTVTAVRKDGTEDTNPQAVSLFKGSLKASIENGHTAVVSAFKPSGGSTRSAAAVVWE